MVYSASMVAATKGTLTGGLEVSGTYFIIQTTHLRYYEFYCRIFIAFMLNIKILQQPNIQKWIMIIIFILLF